MPAGYDASRQVTINSVLDYWLPAYAPIGGALALAVAAALVLRRRRRAAPPAGASR
jgi:uncharacterized protein (TIGR03382 family)